MEQKSIHLETASEKKSEISVGITAIQRRATCSVYKNMCDR